MLLGGDIGQDYKLQRETTCSLRQATQEPEQKVPDYREVIEGTIMLTRIGVIDSEDCLGSTRYPLQWTRCASSLGSWSRGGIEART